MCGLSGTSKSQPTDIGDGVVACALVVGSRRYDRRGAVGAAQRKVQSSRRQRQTNIRALDYPRDPVFVAGREAYAVALGGASNVPSTGTQAPRRSAAQTSPVQGQPQAGQLSNVVDLAMNDQAATFSSFVASSWLSSSMTLVPSLNFTPSSTSATRWWALKRRQRSWAVASSL